MFRKPSLTVAFLALLDSRVPGAHDDLLIQDEMQLLALFLLNLGLTFEDLDLSHGELLELGQDRRLARIHERALERDLLPLEMELPQLRRYFQILKANAGANAGHRPKAPRRKLTLLRAMEPMPDYDEQLQGIWGRLVALWRRSLRWWKSRVWSRISRSSLGWGRLEGARVDVFPTPGHHFSMLAEEHIAELARLLSRELAAAEKAADRESSDDDSKP